MISPLDGLLQGLTRLSLSRQCHALAVLALRPNRKMIIVEWQRQEAPTGLQTLGSKQQEEGLHTVEALVYTRNTHNRRAICRQSPPTLNSSMRSKNCPWMSPPAQHNVKSQVVFAPAGKQFSTAIKSTLLVFTLQNRKAGLWTDVRAYIS